MCYKRKTHIWELCFYSSELCNYGLEVTKLENQIKYLEKILNYKELINNNESILKTQQRFKSEKHHVFTEETNNIALISNDHKIM